MVAISKSCDPFSSEQLLPLLASCRSFKDLRQQSFTPASLLRARLPKRPSIADRRALVHELLPTLPDDKVQELDDLWAEEYICGAEVVRSPSFLELYPIEEAEFRLWHRDLVRSIRGFCNCARSASLGKVVAALNQLLASFETDELPPPPDPSAVPPPVCSYTSLCDKLGTPRPSTAASARALLDSLHCATTVAALRGPDLLEAAARVAWLQAHGRDQEALAARSPDDLQTCYGLWPTLVNHTPAGLANFIAACIPESPPKPGAGWTPRRVAPTPPTPGFPFGSMSAAEEEEQRKALALFGRRDGTPIFPPAPPLPPQPPVPVPSPGMGGVSRQLEFSSGNLPTSPAAPVDLTGQQPIGASYSLQPPLARPTNDEIVAAFNRLEPRTRAFHLVDQTLPPDWYQALQNRDKVKKFQAKVTAAGDTEIFPGCTFQATLDAHAPGIAPNVWEFIGLNLEWLTRCLSAYDGENSVQDGMVFSQQEILKARGAAAVDRINQIGVQGVIRAVLPIVASLSTLRAEHTDRLAAGDPLKQPLATCTRIVAKGIRPYLEAQFSHLEAVLDTKSGNDLSSFQSITVRAMFRHIFKPTSQAQILHAYTVAPGTCALGVKRRSRYSEHYKGDSSDSDDGWSRSSDRHHPKRPAPPPLPPSAAPGAIAVRAHPALPPPPYPPPSIVELRQPVSIAILGVKHGVGVTRGRPCPCPGTWGVHAQAECPFQYQSQLGDWPPGFAQGGTLYASDWQGVPSVTHPHGSELTDAAASRWVDYITRHRLPRAANKPVARLNAPDIPDPNPPPLPLRPPNRGGARP